MSGRVYQGDNEDLRAEGKLAGRAEMAGAASFDLCGFNQRMDELQKSLNAYGTAISDFVDKAKERGIWPTESDEADDEQHEVDFTEAMAEVIDKFQDEPVEQAELHWGYLRGVLQAHGIPCSLIEICGHHYKTAFAHGWKHGQEAMNGKV